jgi:hypothetical protein
MPEQSRGPGPARPSEESELEEASSARTAEDGEEVALLGDGEPVDEVDVAEERWAPGELPPGLPADEVLGVHTLTESEPPAEVLDVGVDDLELPVPAADEPPADALDEDDLDRALHRTTLPGDLETRYEEFDAGTD